MRTEMRSPRAVVLWHSSRQVLWAFTVLAMAAELFLLLSDRGAVFVEAAVGTLAALVLGGEVVETVITDGAFFRGAVAEADFGVGGTTALLAGLAGT
jgi:hypothetical protein